MARTILGWTKTLFTPVAFVFLAYFAWQAKDILVSVVREASVLFLASAVLVWSLLHFLSPALAVFVFGACGSQVTWWQAFSTHAARLPARYAPGGIWHTVGRVMDYHQQGVKPRHLTAFVVIENGFAAAVTLAVGGAMVFGMRGAETLGVVAGLSSLVAIAAIPIIRILLNTRILQQPDHLSLQAYSSGLAVVGIFWVGATLAFLLYLNAFPASTGDYSLVEMGGIYLFSWGVGFIAIFAPQGIGVFEFIASELMHGPIGFMGLAALIAGFRVVVLVADLITWFVYQALRRRINAPPGTAN